jgi:hypothetical protein
MKIGIALGVGLISLGIGCGATPSTQQNVITAGSYEADQLACVDKSTSRAESEACRCIVRARYGRPCVTGDAGVSMFDGGSK